MSLIRAFISLFEKAVIDGNSYFISSFIVLNNNEVLEFTITAPDSPPKTIGIGFEADPGGQLSIDMFRNTILNVTPGGTIITLINSNEESENNANTVVTLNPTIDSDGDLIIDKLLAAGQRNTGGTGDTKATALLAEASGITLVRITSGAAGNTVDYKLGVIEVQ